MELLSIAEISRRLEQPESTIRSWRDRYAEYIPTVGTGRKRRYELEALAVFSKISELTAVYSNSNQVAEALNAHYNRYIEHHNEEHSNTHNEVAIQNTIFSDPIYRITKTLEELVKSNEQRDKLLQRIEELEQRVEELEQGRRIFKRKRKATSQDSQQGIID